MTITEHSNLTKAMAVYQQMTRRGWLNKEGRGGVRIHSRSVVNLYEAITVRARQLTDEQLRFASELASIPENTDASQSYGQVTFAWKSGYAAGCRMTGTCYGARHKDGIRYARVCADGAWCLVALEEVVAWEGGNWKRM